jgi:cytoskeletal protein RodZ
VETLGQDFKRRREERKLSLKDVAEGTRVGVRFLTAIEADDFSALPGGIYTRSFVRAYAKFLGMDEEDVLARYRKQAATEEPAEPMMSYKEYPAESSSASLYIGVVVLLVIIVGGGYGLILYLDQKSESKSVASSSPTPTNSPQATPSPEITPSTQSTPIFEQVVLTLKTKQEAWVSINTDDVEKPLTLTIPANSSRDFKADTKLKVTVGNISAVQAQINGQDAKLPNDGIIAKNIVITKENYQDYIVGGSSPEATPKPKTTGTKTATGSTGSTNPTNPTTTGTTNSTTNSNPESTPSASPKPKTSPKPPSNTTETTIDPTANPDSTPPPRVKKPKDPTNPDGSINVPEAINSPKPKVIKPPSDSGETTPTSTPKASPKPKTTPKPDNTEAKPN